MGMFDQKPIGPMTGYTKTGGASPSQAVQFGEQAPVNATGSGAGGAGILTALKTGGFGNMPAGASGRSQALRGQASNMNWQDMRYGGGTGRGQGMESMSDQANLQAQSEQEGQAKAEWDEKMRMMRMRGDLMQKLMSLFSGQGAGGAGGNLNVGMPVQPDPNIMASLRAGVQEQFDPLERQEQKISAGQNRSAFDSTARTQAKAGLAGRKASAMSQTYAPGQAATVAGYQPGLEAARINKQGQITPQLIMQMLMGGQGGMA